MPIVKPGFEKKALLSEIKQKLSTIEGFKLPNRDDVPDERYCFRTMSPFYKHFCLIFNEQNELFIETDNHLSTPVYHLEQIYTLVDKMNSESKRLEANYLKRKQKRETEKLKKQKIKALKHKAIIAKINEIAKEEKFEFYIMEYATKVKLVVRLAESEKMEIDIPYAQFQETLKNLRVAIQTLKDLRHSGITFKIRNLSYREPEWKKLG
ncbi:hypothetical protein THIOM_000423 [Candidatus Thiomargarita nelsonii]|uniref:Uncharacterized protein n=1 Tax=Candidatus Thiomargarita nelsonii TaxID=1003181 RepID=A0A176S6S3_9GAMM|nr:hypothetical protein THIOM_000423 [Candidatus Thiomargarita nelsonii]